MKYVGKGQGRVGLMKFAGIEHERVGQDGICRDRTGKGRTRWNMPG